MSDLTAEQVRVVSAIARKGAEAVPQILARLDPDQGDCIPLMVALGQIGTRQAAPRLEEIAAQYEAATPVGHYARKALALCEGEAAPSFAREALESGDQGVVELGFWMVTHGHLYDLHPEVACASRRLAEAEQLQGTPFLEAAIVARSSATDDSWRDLLHASRRVIFGNHTIWLYRPMIRSGLPDACQLLLQFVIRVWQEYRQPVNGTTYALWALAEEAVSSDQVAKVDKWLQYTVVQEGLAQALMALWAKDGFGHALQVAAKVGAGSLQDMMSESLGSDRLSLQAADLACTVPHSASVSDLAAIAPDWDANTGIAIRCAEALAAHGSPEAFGALAEVLRSWELLTGDVGTAFASAAVSLGRVPECRAWLADSSEAKCLRQACALAVGHALGHDPDGSDSGDAIAALESALGEDGDVANAAAMAANMSRHPRLLPSLKWLVDNSEPAAFEALFAIAAIGTRPALEFLYETCASHAVSHLSGAPAEALAKALGMHFRNSTDRNGPDWDRANKWLVEIYKRFVRELSSGDIGTDVVVTQTLLGFALEWDIDALSGVVEAESRADTGCTRYSSSNAHLRWRLLARHRPGCLIELAHKHIAEALSESNKPEMARGLLDVVAPEYLEEARDLVLAIVQQSKTFARRQIARDTAEVKPSWLEGIEVCEAHGPFLRDVAVLSSADTSQAIINRLLDAATRAIRRYGYEAQQARERQEQAIAAYSEFRDDECPFHRLWWVNSFVAHADEVALTQLHETCTPPRDLARQFALREMEEQVGKRLKKEAAAEDRSIEGGFRPWIW